MHMFNVPHVSPPAGSKISPRFVAEYMQGWCSGLCIISGGNLLNKLGVSQPELFEDCPQKQYSSSFLSPGF